MAQPVETADNSVLTVTDILHGLPNIKQGVAWSAIDNRFNYIGTMQMATWKGVSFEVGYAGHAKNTADKAIVAVSYPILKLKDLGVTLPILDLVEFNAGVYAGYGRVDLTDGLGDGNNEFDAGASLTLIEVKF